MAVEYGDALKEDDDVTLWVRMKLGAFQLATGPSPDQIAPARELLTECERVLVPGHPTTLAACANLGILLLAAHSGDSGHSFRLVPDTRSG